MSKQNAKIYRAMLEETSRITPENEAKRIFVRNLQNFLCAALVTENVSCVPSFQDGRLKLGFHLANQIHFCQGEDLEFILSNFHQKKGLEDWNSQVEIQEVPMEEDVESFEEEELVEQELAECKKMMEEQAAELQKLKEELEENEEETEDSLEETSSEEDTSIVENANLIEDATMPIYETIYLNRDVENERIFVSWQGEVSRIGVTVEGKKFYVEAPEDKRQSILITSAKSGSNIKLSFEGNAERIFWRWEEDEESESY